LDLVLIFLGCIDFNEDVHTVFELDFQRLKELILRFSIEESSSLAYAMSHIDPVQYEGIISPSRNELISVLKEKTETLSIIEDGDSLIIDYIVSDKLQENKQSVDRINFISSFLPGYKVYGTNGLRPPIPFLEVITDNHDETHKRMPVENVENPFQQYVNQLWLRHCLEPYEYMTVYDWQERIIAIRKEGVSLAQYIIQFIEHYLSGNNSIKKSKKGINTSQKNLLDLIQTKKFFSRKWHSSSKENIPMEKQKPIDDWVGCWQRVLGQFHELFFDNEDMRRAAIYNIKDLYSSLEGMHQAYRETIKMTSKYFDYIEIEKDEIRVYKTLAHSCMYLYENKQKAGKIFNARKIIASYFGAEDKKRIGKIQCFLDELYDIFSIEGLCPVRTVEEGNVRHAAIALSGDAYDENGSLLSNVFALFRELKDIDVHFWHMIHVEDKKVCQPNVTRISQIFINELDDLFNGLTEELKTIPLPVPIDERILDTLPGIECDLKYLEEQNASPLQTQHLQFLNELWCLSFAFQSLSSDSIYEKRYLDKINDSCRRKLNSISIRRAIFQELVDEYDRVLSGHVFSRDYYQDLFLRISQKGFDATE